MDLTHQEDDRWREYAEHGGEDGAEVHPRDPCACRVALHGLFVNFGGKFKSRNG